MPIFHEGRRRIKADLVQKLRFLAPRLELHSREQWLLVDEYNTLLDQARDLQDLILDELEAAQERGEGPGRIDLAHYFWSRAMFTDVDQPTRSVVRDADLLEGLPGDC